MYNISAKDINKLEDLKTIPVKDQKVTFKDWEKVAKFPHKPDIKDILVYYHPIYGTIWHDSKTYDYEGNSYKTLKKAMNAAKIQAWENKLKKYK